MSAVSVNPWKSKMDAVLNELDRKHYLKCALKELNVSMEKHPIEGQTSWVHKAVWKNETIAVKIAKDISVARVIREAGTLESLKTVPFVVRSLHSVCSQRKQACAIFMPYATDMLITCHAINNPIPLPKLILVVSKFLQTLSSLAICGIVHCDIKPDNLSCLNAPALLDMGDAISIKSREGLSIFAGTLGYLSPEVALQSKKWDSRLDVWNLAAAAFAIYTGSPLEGMKSLKDLPTYFSGLLGRFGKEKVEEFLSEYYPEEKPDWVSQLKPTKLNWELQIKEIAKSRKEPLEKAEQLIEILKPMFELDFTKRITAAEAVVYVFGGPKRKRED